MTKENIQWLIEPKWYEAGEDIPDPNNKGSFYNNPIHVPAKIGVDVNQCIWIEEVRAEDMGYFVEKYLTEG